MQEVKDCHETTVRVYKHEEILMISRYSDSYGNEAKPPTVLIAEDHDVLRATLRDWISASFPRIYILEAKNGEEALSLSFDQKPDVILMDISMPRMNGLEATRRIKKGVPQTQIVFVTIHESLEYKSDAAAAGASAYIFKRRMQTELMPVLKSLLFPQENKGEENWRK